MRQKIQVIVSSFSIVFIATLAFAEEKDEKGRYPSEIEASLQADRDYFEIQKRMKTEKEMAWKNRIELPLADDICLAHLRGAGKCLLTAADFNREVDPLNRALRPDSGRGESKAEVLRIRKAILDRLWEDIYRRAAVDSLASSDATGISGAWENRLREAEKGIGSAKLDNLYRRNYKEFFAARWRYDIQLIGASDSLFLDSLSASLPESDQAGRSKTDTSEGIEPGSGTRVYLWQALASEEVPEIIAASLRSLKAGQKSPIIKTPFGWFVAKITRAELLPAKSREEALSILLGLAALPGSSAEVSRGESSGSRSVTTMDGSDRDPEIRFWLIPYSKVQGRPQILSKWADTSRVASMRTRLSLLPDSLRAKFISHATRDGFGIIKDRFGVWYLQASGAPNDFRLRMHGKPGSRTAARHEELDEAENHRRALRHMDEKKRDFMNSQLQRQIGESETVKIRPDTSGARQSPELKTNGNAIASGSRKWIEENVSLEYRLLEP